MAGVIAPVPANPTLRQRARRFLSAQIVDQRLRWRLWAPVAFGGGCAAYFGLKSEPAVWPMVFGALFAAGLWLGARRLAWPRLAVLPLMLLTCFAFGMAVSKLRTDAVAAPIAPAMAEPTVVEGWVIDVDSPGSVGPRVVIAPVRIQGLLPEATPERIRATVRGPAPEPGQAVRLFALINPPPAPASPGAYDFGLNAYFQSLGGVAFSLGETRRAWLAPPPWNVRAAMWVNSLRYDLAQRIVARLGERTGGIAAAMTTGHEVWLNPDEVQVMRDSGLAHILSISGLHMAVVGGFAFFLVRLLVAAWPWLALRVSGKKVAAWAGLVAVGGYLVVSGHPPPAERAAITASIAFLAVLLDRPAISMHALAVAALIVLLLQPEAIVTPGFQMSFAATAALVALVEAWPVRPREISAPLPILIIQRAGAWLGIAILASLVAGAATGPFAMQHFNRTAMYGLLANLMTAPVSDFLIMPALALGAVLEPFGLGGPFLWLAGQGIALMLAIGGWTASLPGAVKTIASAPDYVLPIAFVGVLFCCLWQGPLRWVGLPFAAAVMLWPRAPTPDVWIGDGGTNGAYVENGQAVVIRTAVREFAVDVWTRRRGVPPVQRATEAWACTRASCAPAEVNTAPLAMWWGRRAPSPEEIDALCRSAPVVSVRATVAALPPSCEGRLVLDSADYARGGAVELWRDGPVSANRWRAVWAAEVRGDRPWSRPG